MTALGDLQEYVAIPRVTQLVLSPDGTWLAATVQQPSPDGKKYASAIWRIPVADGRHGEGDRVATRLTWSAQGEDGPAFLPDGSLLFRSARPDPAAAGGGEWAGGTDRSALWLLPADGGEARRVAAPAGGVISVATAREVPDLLIVSPMLPGVSTDEDDADHRKRREEAGVTAVLHEGAPVRHWDHDLGPDEPRLLAARVDAGGLTGAPRDLTPVPGRALDEHRAELVADGSLAVTGWSVRRGGPGHPRDEIAVIGTGTGVRRTLLAAAGVDFDRPRVSPDGRWVACVRTAHDSYEEPGDVTLVLSPVDGSAGGTDLLPGLDRRPEEVAWAGDGRAVFFTADDHGRRPVFRAGVPGNGAAGDRAAPAGNANGPAEGGNGPAGNANGTGVTRITSDDGCYESLWPSPDGRYLYALRSAVDSPPAPVRLDLAEPGSPPHHLPAPAGQPVLPGRLTEVEATADDGALIRGWLVLPEAASAARPAPLLLWVHGGPLSSWNSWSWRWNPWLMAAAGYAVLLPDPALSTGYGHAFIARGHGNWGERPFADLMAITDATVARPDIDAERTAVMGGSYGGYMANWIAGHTDRFRAIVSHAGLWALDQMSGTTDDVSFMRRSFGDPLTRPERYQANSPHRHLARIATPMLVIHGDKDYRVPIGEALRLWADLTGERGTGADSGTQFLYFPTENHWILTPGNALVWYRTVLAFLAHHVLGEPWQRPDLL